MDAKVGDWVETPRRGKAVEINALWYNALCLLAGWLRRAAGAGAGAVGEVGDGGSAGEDGGPEGDGGGEGTAEESAILAGPVPVWAADPAGRAMQVAALARRVRASFNRRFWYAAGGHLYDVVDGERGDDAACRPNQIFALSLPHPVLARERWPVVLETVRQRLLTPVGLRSLAPGEPEFRAAYDGDLRARDAAYHQGTVWAWLIGPFVDAWLRVHPGDLAGARGFLQGFVPHLGEACLGTISEIFDAEAPWTPRGCVSQAWSVAEVLRAWLLTTPHGAGAVEGTGPAAG
jgi:glycogen debranching enzyme